MGDQLRNNTGKLELSYVYANARAVTSLCGDTYVVAGFEPNLADVQLQLLSFTSGGPRECLVASTMSLLCFMENGMDPDGFTVEDTNDGTILLNFPYAWQAYINVLKFGETKYARGNYRLGAPITQYLDCAWRHLTAHGSGELYDPDAAAAGFNVLHLGSTLWNLVQALEQPDCRDDRLPATQHGPFDPNEGGPWIEVDL